MTYLWEASSDEHIWTEDDPLEMLVVESQEFQPDRTERFQHHKKSNKQKQHAAIT